MTRVCLLLTALLAYAHPFGDMPAAPQALEPEVAASEGGTVTLRCLFHGNPPPKITWRFRAHIIDGTAGRYRLMSDGALEIVSLYRNDTGVYICVAENVLGVAMQVIQLVVSGGGSEPFEEECNKLNFDCIYGVEEINGTDGGERCRCKQSPCEKTPCGVGKRCVIHQAQTSVPSIGQEPLFTATCGTMLKGGVCPTEETGPHRETCSRECKDDADCRGVGKCCQRGCSHLCLAPVEQPSTHPLPTTTTTAFAPGSGCTYTLHGCCPDNVTNAQGPDNQGCGCQYTQNGCCPDGQTVASGPNNEGCTCKTYHNGCCADGVTMAVGPEQQGCHCFQSKFGCCGDGVTHATGPDGAGCDCSSSKHGCCPDNRNEAFGPKLLGCTDAPEKQTACSMSPDTGPCYNFTAMWHYNMSYGSCTRFWYGGCDGNSNNFGTKEECEDVCVHPSPKDACKLPGVKGDCDKNYTHWHYNSTREQCVPFIYGGCFGNANNFDSRELCQKECEPISDADPCFLPIDQGSCVGNYSRWGFNSEAHRCEQFNWGGCGGNSNRFSSETACRIHCVDKHPPQCRQPQEAGNCNENEALWSFSESEKRCLLFYYSGCGGNDNQFSSRVTCEQTCLSPNDPVKMAVGIAGDEKVVIGELGYPLQLHCRPYEDPPAYTTWYRGDAESLLLYNNTVYVLIGNVLLIRSLAIDTLGPYTCEAIYGEGRAASRGIIVQAYKPEGLYDDNEYLVPRGTMSPNPGTQATFTTKTTSSTSTTEAPTPLFKDPVKMAVGIAGDEKVVIGELGYPLQLHCRPYEDPPAYTTWYFGHAELPLLYNNTVYELRGNVLLIKSLAIDTLGLYTCEAIYGDGQAASRGIIVQAYGPEGLYEDNEYLVSRGTVPHTTGTQPTFTTKTTSSTSTTEAPTPLFKDPVRMAVGIAGDEKVVTGELGYPLQLHCRPYGDPPPYMTWYRGHTGSPLLYNNTVYEPRGNALLIRSLAIDTLGLYTCEAIYGDGQAASRGIIAQAFRPEGFFTDEKYLVSRGTMSPTTGTQPTYTTETPTPLFNGRPGRGTMDATFALRQFYEKYRRAHKNLHMVFIDLEKAHDIPGSVVVGHERERCAWEVCGVNCCNVQPV